MGGKNIPGIIISLALFVLLISCGPEAQPPLKHPETGLRTEIGQALPDKASEWDSLLSLAKKEKRVFIYSVANGDFRAALVKVLREKFNIEVDIVTGRSSELTLKLLNERAAGIYSADVYIGGGGGIVNDLMPYGVFDSIPELLLPEVTDPKSWWNGQITFVDKGKRAVAMVANPSPPFYFNTSIVRSGEINSYQDLLNDKWKGKIIINDPTIAGSAQYWFAIASNIVGVDYMKQLANMNPVVTRDQRLQVEWLAHGRFPIAIACDTTIVTQFRKAGATLDQFIPREGTHLTSSSGNIALINKAPHPAAAQVFLNWMLTKEAQTILSQSTGFQSARTDVPTEHLDQDKVRKPGVKYFSVIDEGFIKSLPEHARIAREIFGPLLR